MKLYLLIILSITELFSASLEHLSINKYDFSSVIEHYDIYDSKGVVMKLYREEKNKNLSFVLRLTLQDSTGNCSSRSMEDGSYEVNGSTIILYSLWTRRGKAYLTPYGARIQHFEIQNDGTLKQTSGQIYLETTRRKHDNNSGMKYLFTPAKTDEEKKEFNAYVKEVERIYSASFISKDDEVKALIKEVKMALKRKMKSTWKK
jgi:hypothetical protein